MKGCSLADLAFNLDLTIDALLNLAAHPTAVVGDRQVGVPPFLQPVPKG